MAQSDIRFGIKGGMTSSNMKGDAVSSLNDILEVTDGILTTRNQTGFYAGASVSIPVSSQFSIEPGIQYRHPRDDGLRRTGRPVG